MKYVKNKYAITIIFGILLQFISTLVATSINYYTNDHEITLHEPPNQIIIQLNGIQNEDSLQQVIINNENLKIKKIIDRNSSLFLLEFEGEIISQSISNLDTLLNPIRWLPAYYTNDDFNVESEYFLGNGIIIKFIEEISIEGIEELAEEYGIELVNGHENSRRCIFRLKDTNLENPINLSMYIENDDRTQWAEVKHKAKIILNEDEYYPFQWHLNNTGQSTGTPGIDINILPLWEIGIFGSEDIIVAIIDDGVDGNNLEAEYEINPHGDFLLNQVLDGYTIPNEIGDTQGRPMENGKHGQSVTGIIGAQHNDIGVRGIAPNVKILPVNILFNGIDNYADDVAFAIDWAWDEGEADILSCSWHLNEYSPDVENAIQEATINGRSGLGSIVVFSAGNTETINFPAYLDFVIAVSGIDHNGQKSHFYTNGPPSDYRIDLVAPTMNTYLPADFHQHEYTDGGIVTLDRVESLGYIPNYDNGNFIEENDYQYCFGGTYASCPQVSGVAALLLSLNPDLLKEDVEFILYETATNVDPEDQEDWDGFGMVNALNAILELFPDGDINFDQEVNVNDLVEIADFILSNTIPGEAQFVQSDLNQDEIIDILDVILVVNIITNEDGGVFEEYPIDLNFISKVVKQKDDPPYVQEVNIKNDVPVRGIQVTVIPPPEFIPVDAYLSDHALNMTLSFKIDSNKVKILIYSVEGEQIETGFGPIVEIPLDLADLGRDDVDPGGGVFEEIILTYTGNDSLPYMEVNPEEFGRITQDSDLNESTIPNEFQLYLPTPNPFNPITTVTYDIPKESYVIISVYDLTGRKLTDIVNSTTPAGSHTIQWNASNYSSGNYFINLVTKDYTKTQKVMLLK